MLKGFVSGVEKDIIRIPMKVGNEYKEGWEVRDNQDRLIWGREDELQTTTGTLKFKGYGLPVKVKSLLGNAVQNGTPTPDAPITPEFVGTLDGADWKILITNTGQTTNVYLGQVQTVRRIKKLVLTGEETGWSENTSGTNTFRGALTLQYENMTGADGFCSHNIYKISGISVDEEACSCCHGALYFRISKTIASNVAAFKQWLSQQYAAGTPVTVWYVLTTPETGIVNEPLVKIGDYADELNNTVATLPEIPTTSGQNTLTVDTTLAPSSLTIKGHIKEWQPENLLPVSKFEDLSDPSYWSGGYYVRYNNMPAGTYVMSTNMPEKDPGDVYFNGENALNVPYEGRPVSITINEGDSFYVLFFVDRGGYESILNGTYTVTLVRS